MRIVLVSDCYLPRLGGIEVQVSDLAAALRAAGHEVLVLTATPGEDTPGVLRLLPPVPLPVPVNPWAGPRLRAALAGADVVHVHLGVLAPFATHAVRVALELGRPTVVTWHSMMAAPVLAALRRTAPWAGWVREGVTALAVSRPLRDQLGSVLGSAAAVEVLNNGIDVQRWAAPAPAPPRPDGTVVLACSLRFARRKRPVALLDLAEAIRAAVPDDIPLELVIAGDGPLLAPTRRLAARRGLDWVVLPGRLTREELARSYRQSHLYLAPARLESFGIAALEARTAGLPVVGLRDSGITEFVTDGVHGVLVADDAELARAAAALVVQEGRRVAMAEHNRTHVPDQAWHRCVEQLEAVYARSRAGRGRPPRH